ncbi:hypothetical protein Cob_v009015 [Colletotrichum orbiculare MAFF 240422]|uniref:Uncharacterized protein n=1 Tax=Colletotrichum orbiculare (strain 104-T / ATCC 96160 / CBS 514.97 / LARS 414 / MAFF 240422) TaxID=1213857 RepID=N4W5V2_COLOR|nr:hypothetical protein Cob_v009015 [Colletotrichum orbiculare MAFF 240422]
MSNPGRLGSPYPNTSATFRSKFGPRYNTIPNINGWTVSQFTKFGYRAAGFGAAAGVAALFYTSGIPRIQRDILQKVPIFGQNFTKEIHPADNPF